MSWIDDIERAVAAHCIEFPRKGQPGFVDILPVGIFHSPYTYGEKKRIFCGMCERLLTDADIALLRSRFSLSTCSDSKTCVNLWSGRGL